MYINDELNKLLDDITTKETNKKTKLILLINVYCNINNELRDYEKCKTFDELVDDEIYDNYLNQLVKVINAIDKLN